MEPTLLKVMSEYKSEEDDYFDKYEKIAVIGIELFNDLDKHFLPYSFDEIDFFKKGDYQIDTIYEVGNDREVADNAVALIDPEKANDYAIVMNVSSPLTDAVKSALYRKGIAFKNDLFVKDLGQIRDYLQFLTLSLSFPTLRVKHVNELFQSFNCTFPSRIDEFLLSKQLRPESDRKIDKLVKLMSEIRTKTFAEVNKELFASQKTPNGNLQVQILIGDLNLTTKAITRKKVSELVYAVNNISDLHHTEEIPENERTGVLLTDCTKSVYIDRPAVIFLGMEQDWNQHIVGKRYLYIEDETEKNDTRLKILLQQGYKRAYIVNTTKNGKAARPTLTFDHIIGETAKDFSKVCKNLIHSKWAVPVNELESLRGEYDIDKGHEFNTPFSKSSFNAYMSCPRRFMFTKLIPTPDEKDNAFGNLIHQFAEFYVCYPEIYHEKGLDFFVEMTTDKFSGLSSPLMYRLDSDKVKLCMKNIVRFIDSLGIPYSKPDRTIEPNYENMFFKAFGLDKSSVMCETDVDSTKYPITGRMDLYSRGIITDYKTGRAHSGKEIVQAMNAKNSKVYLEYQPIIYLALALEKKGSENEFDLFYAMDNDFDSLEDDFDIDRNVRKIYLKEGSLADCIARNEEIRESFRTGSNKFNKKFAPYADDLIDAFAANAKDDPSTWDTDEDVIVNALKAVNVSTAPSNRDTMGAAIRKFKKLVTNGMIYTDTSVIIPIDTLNKFMESFVETHKIAMEQSRTELPADTIFNCKDCKYFYACTKDKVKIEDSEEGSE